MLGGLKLLPLEMQGMGCSNLGPAGVAMSLSRCVVKVRDPNVFDGAVF